VGVIDEERQLNVRLFQRACAAALLIAIPVVTAVQAGAAEKQWRHGLSLFGDLKYKPDFKHFDYVNPNAPKGGTVRQLAIGTFDNFNMVVAGAKGTMAAGVDLVYDTLMILALDEVSAEYGLLAESVSHPDDFSSVTYRLRPQAKFHDGSR
jgi:microcin C transport system substrate-binding protein